MIDSNILNCDNVSTHVNQTRAEMHNNSNSPNVYLSEPEVTKFPSTAYPENPPL